MTVSQLSASSLSFEAVQEQLRKILSSRALSHSKRLIRFLSFVVEKGLKGEGGQLNEYQIGVEVYQRPVSFDPQIDTIVRTEARRLRLKLHQYYETEGIYDPILIEIPKGSYLPAFRERERGILDKNPGQVISHYRLLEKLGEGGMGTVYLAEDTHLGRQVALKFIHNGHLREKYAKARLIREARAAGVIDHPNVAAIYEASEVEGHPFIVMAYVRGQNLEDRIPEGPMEIREALDIGCQLADGLKAAHELGVVHRDLNPANVILGEDGRVRIIDFGVAKLSFASRLTQPGTDIGTANYVSPEQMKGEDVDQRTDIWSLGVILYELLTGKKPFEAEHREAVYYAIAYRTPEPMSRWRTGISEKLERVVLKCLEKEPTNRYFDVAELKADLLIAQSEVLQAQEILPSTLSTHGQGAQKSDQKNGSVIHLSMTTRGPGSGLRSDQTNPLESPLTEGDTFEGSPKSISLQSQGGQMPGEEQLSPGTHLVGSLRFLGRTGGWIAVTTTLAVMLVLAGSAWWFRSTQPKPSREASTTASTSIPRLVVLPFESRSPGEENQALGYAISDSLISRLANLSGMEVTSWTSAVRLTERKATLSEIAKILNVQYALEGSLLKVGQEGRVTAQLIRLSDDTHIWSEEFDLPWKDILAVRQKLSESVVRHIQIQVLPKEQRLLARNSTQNVDAYQAYARGRYSLVRFSNFRDPIYLAEAEKHFKRALEEDPTYANALADLGYLNFQRLYPPQGDRKELVSQGIAYLQRALTFDPNHVVALFTLGSLYDEIGEPDKGLELCRKAIQLGPNNPEAHHHLGWRYFERGFYESGIVENRVAIAKDTLFMDPYLYNIIFLDRLGRFEEASATLNKLAALEPTSHFPRLLRGDVAFCRGDLSQAEAEWRPSLDIASKRSERSDFTHVLLATISARRGQIEEARRVLNNFDSNPSRLTDYVIKLAALVGNKDLAINLVRNNTMNRNYRWLISDPDITSLRNEPRFRELLYELYQKWQHDLAELGPALPVLPPKLPTPEEFLRHPVK